MNYAHTGTYIHNKAAWRQWMNRNECRACKPAVNHFVVVVHKYCKHVYLCACVCKMAMSRVRHAIELCNWSNRRRCGRLNRFNSIAWLFSAVASKSFIDLIFIRFVLLIQLMVVVRAKYSQSNRHYLRIRWFRIKESVNSKKEKVGSIESVCGYFIYHWEEK